MDETEYRAYIVRITEDIMYIMQEYLLNRYYIDEIINYAKKVTKDEKMQIKIDEVLRNKECMDKLEDKIQEEWIVIKKYFKKHKHAISKVCDGSRDIIKIKIYEKIYEKMLSFTQLLYLSFLNFKKLYAILTIMVLDPDTKENTLKLEEDINNNIKFDYIGIKEKYLVEDSYLKEGAEFPGVDPTLEIRISTLEELILRIDVIFGKEVTHILNYLIDNFKCKRNVRRYTKLVLDMMLDKFKNSI